MTKGFILRLYPTKEEERLSWKHIGSCRYIWNYMLDYQQKRYEAGEKHLSAFDMMNLLPALKKDKEHEWLKEVSATSLQVVCSDLNEAYQRFFKKTSGFPKFKSRKRSKPSFPVGTQNLWFDNKGFAHIGKIGRVHFKTDFELPIGRGHKFLNPRISFVNDKWLLSFGMECENQAPTLTDKPMGIDLGVKDLAVAEFDGSPIAFHNINKSKRMRQLKQKQKRLQRSISRKYEANRKGNRYVKTKNIERQEAQLRKLHTRITNIRMNYIHQSTHALVSLLPCRVVMEDLNIQGMMKNRHLSKAIQEQCLYEFIRQMKYKCEWNGIEFVQVDRFYPSSKTCSKCGNVKRNLKLSDRMYHCDSCGAVIDRDYNAAINLSRHVA